MSGVAEKELAIQLAPRVILSVVVFKSQAPMFMGETSIDGRPGYAPAPQPMDFLEAPYTDWIAPARRYGLRPRFRAADASDAGNPVAARVAAEGLFVLTGVPPAGPVTPHFH